MWSGGDVRLAEPLSQKLKRSGADRTSEGFGSEEEANDVGRSPSRNFEGPEGSLGEAESWREEMMFLCSEAWPDLILVVADRIGQPAPCVALGRQTKLPPCQFQTTSPECSRSCVSAVTARNINTGPQ